MFNINGGQEVECAADVLIDYSPDALQKMLEIVSLSAAGDMLCVIAWLGVGYLLWRKTEAIKARPFTTVNQDRTYQACCAGLVLILFFNIPAILNLWTWMAIFNPELVLSRSYWLEASRDCPELVPVLF